MRGCSASGGNDVAITWLDTNTRTTPFRGQRVSSYKSWRLRGFYNGRITYDSQWQRILDVHSSKNRSRYMVFLSSMTTLTTFYRMRNQSEHRLSCLEHI